MELTAFQRVNSIGQSLYARGKVDFFKDRYQDLVQTPSFPPAISQTLSKLPLPTQCKLALRRFAKGFGITYGISTAMAIIGELVKKRGNIVEIVKNWKAIFMGPKLNSCAFVGLFLALFEIVMRFARFRDKNMSTKFKRSLIGGFVAGASLFLIRDKQLRISVAVFFFVRAMEALVKYAILFKMFPALPFYEVWLVCLSCMQICWAAIYNKESLEPGYSHFIDYHGGKTNATYNSLNDVFGKGVTDSKNILKLNEERCALHLPSLDMSSKTLSCQIWHGTIDQSCENYIRKYFMQEYKRAMILYTPIYIIPALIFKPKKLLNPLKFVADNALAVGRSSLFLGSFTSAGMYTFCFLQKVFGYFGYERAIVGYDGILSGLFAGPTILLESPSRRHELSLYMVGHALRSFYFTWQKYLPRTFSFNYGEVLIFSCSMSILMHVYITKSYLLRPGYFSLFRFFFGSGGKLEGFPTEQVHLELPDVVPIDKSGVEIYSYENVKEYKDFSEN